MLEEIDMVWNVNAIKDYSIENCKTKEDFERHRELYLEGAFAETCLFDAVLDEYSCNSSIYSLSKKYGVKTQAVRKILITAGLYTSEKQQEIMKLYEQGLSLKEISKKLSISKPTVDSYLPLYAKWGKSEVHKGIAIEDSKFEKAKELTQELIDEVDYDYRSGYSIDELMKNYGFSKRKILKILVTSGTYSTPRVREIENLIRQGKNPRQIADVLNITESMVNTYIPYKRSAYNTGEPTKNAVYSKNYRTRKKKRNIIKKRIEESI